MTSSIKLSLKSMFGALFLAIFLVQFYQILTAPAPALPKPPTPPALETAAEINSQYSPGNPWADFTTKYQQGLQVKYQNDYQAYQRALQQYQKDESNDTNKAVALGTQLGVTLIIGLWLLRSAWRQMKEEGMVLKDKRRLFMEYLKNHQKTTSTICVVFVMLGVYFYWYQYRPAAIKESCYAQTFSSQADWIKQASFGADDGTLKATYDGCLASRGL